MHCVYLVLRTRKVLCGNVNAPYIIFHSSGEPVRGALSGSGSILSIKCSSMGSKSPEVRRERVMTDQSKKLQIEIVA